MDYLGPLLSTLLGRLQLDYLLSSTPPVDITVSFEEPLICVRVNQNLGVNQNLTGGDFIIFGDF
ncbi:hypothetical protein LEMLEM_LOCUS19635 [Lemmus lemmus]